MAAPILYLSLGDFQIRFSFLMLMIMLGSGCGRVFAGAVASRTVKAGNTLNFT
jgi:hypothetical protein